MPRPKTATRTLASSDGPLQVVRVFVSYSHEDKTSREKLEKHLAQIGREGVAIWWDDAIPAGDAIDPAISRELRRAHLFIALLSPDYLAIRYCWDVEYKRAMSRRARGFLRVVAVVIRPCDWKATRAKHFKALPKDGRPVSNWRSADEALVDVAQGVREVVKLIRKELVTAAAEVTQPSMSKAPKSKGLVPGAAKPRAAPRGVKRTTRSKGTAKKGPAGRKPPKS